MFILKIIHIRNYYTKTKFIVDVYTINISHEPDKSALDSTCVPSSSLIFLITDNSLFEILTVLLLSLCIFMLKKISVLLVCVKLD